jgi:DNA gyrase/topoisomerase IV subunit A
VGERSGLGEVEIAVLSALDSLGARPGRGYVRSARVLAVIEDLIGLAPGYAYQVLIDLAQPWTVPVTLVSGQGNFGSRGNDPPASFRYTDARLSEAGAVALAAERGELAPVPIGLINGNTYREGTRPPFRAAGVIAAIREVVSSPDAAAAELVSIVGPPVFPTGHAGRGDLEGLAAGQATELRLEADVTISPDGHQVIVENIPFGSTTDDAAIGIANRAEVSRRAERHPDLAQATRLPLSDIRDVTDRDHPNGRFVCTPARGTSPEELRARLLDIYGVHTTVRAKLPCPLPAMIRTWAATYAAEDLAASLIALEMAL